MTVKSKWNIQKNASTFSAGSTDEDLCLADGFPARGDEKAPPLSAFRGAREVREAISVDLGPIQREGITRRIGLSKDGQRVVAETQNNPITAIDAKNDVVSVEDEDRISLSTYSRKKI